MSEARPFDLLNNSIGSKISIRLKDAQEVKGTLRSFDVHMNLVLENAKETNPEGSKEYETVLVRGDNILFVSPVYEE